jgi:DNA sulfur modification protein DndD
MQKKVAEITGTIELRQKVTIIQQILTDALADARQRLRTVILQEVNDRLRKVLYRDPLEVASIDSCVRLKSQEGASVGQTLTVGYVFLTTLLSRGQHQVPLVIDSPANPLSIEVRREVGKIIPTLCKQFVAFTISSERAGFVRPLDETAGGSIGYFTLFRKTPGTAALLSGLPQQGVTQTESGVLVTGKDYFENFDLEEEA